MRPWTPNQGPAARAGPDMPVAPEVEGASEVRVARQRRASPRRPLLRQRRALPKKCPTKGPKKGPPSSEVEGEVRVLPAKVLLEAGVPPEGVPLLLLLLLRWGRGGAGGREMSNDEVRGRCSLRGLRGAQLHVHTMRALGPPTLTNTHLRASLAVIC